MTRVELFGRSEIDDARVGVDFLDETAEHRPGTHLNIRGDAVGRKTTNERIPLDW